MVRWIITWKKKRKVEESTSKRQNRPKIVKFIIFLQNRKNLRKLGNEFPLVVKLGTITPHGADVYSYAPDEDNEVKDPKLAEHLAHWGIDIMKLEKTDKTMEELELEQNKNWTSRITESDTVLKEVDGPGLKGLINLGNSCLRKITIS